MYYWGHTFLAVFYALALMVVLTKIKSGAGIPLLRARPLVYAGTISYGVYLFHPLVLTLTFALAGRPDKISTSRDFGFMLLAVAATWRFVNFRTAS